MSTDALQAADCGHEITRTGIRTGYARIAAPRPVNGRTLPADATVCYPCADSLQAEDMATSDRIDAYVSGDGRNVTTWSGGVLARIVTATEPRVTYTPTGGRVETVYVIARDADGRTWHGRGPGRGMYVRLRRSQSSV